MTAPNLTLSEPAFNSLLSAWLRSLILGRRTLGQFMTWLSAVEVGAAPESCKPLSGARLTGLIAGAKLILFSLRGEPRVENAECGVRTAESEIVIRHSSFERGAQRGARERSRALPVNRPSPRGLKGV